MKKLAALTVILALGSGVATAETLKIGIVNMAVVSQKAPMIATINEDLAKKFKPKQDEINAANQKLQSNVTRLNLNGATMSPEEQSKLQAQIITDKANLEILNTSLQRDISIAKDQGLRSFMVKLGKVLSKIAKDGNYDLIEQNTNALYVNPKIDITQEVLKQF